MTLTHRLLLAALLCPLACAGDLDNELGGDAVEPPAEGRVGPHTTSDPRDGGGHLSTVDASDEVLWVYFDLETGTELEVFDPTEDLRWDLAFRRFHIATNSGVSGSAGSEVALLSQPFDDVSELPDAGFVVDEADGDDENEDPDYAFRDWYDYNFMTHVLTPQAQTYVVVTGSGNAFKVALERYYDEAGTSGFPTVAWAAL
ncbi:MAG: HmuY family protein [Nannocystaceae bacterium]|nr:HmuY family protein [Nannocystaceae bacterium]